MIDLPPCQRCGEPFQPRRAWSKYCSPACRARAHDSRRGRRGRWRLRERRRKRIQIRRLRPCRGCGVMTRQIFCSEHCRQQCRARWAFFPRPKQEFTCEHCGNKSKGRARQRFCSRLCATRNWERAHRPPQKPRKPPRSIMQRHRDRRTEIAAARQVYDRLMGAPAKLIVRLARNAPLVIVDRAWHNYVVLPNCKRRNVRKGYFSGGRIGAPPLIRFGEWSSYCVLSCQPGRGTIWRPWVNKPPARKQNRNDIRVLAAYMKLRKKRRKQRWTDDDRVRRNRRDRENSAIFRAFRNLELTKESSS